MEAAKLVRGKNDQRILAAVLYVKPDYFITGDKHFHTRRIKERIKIRNAQEVLKELGVE